MAVRSGGFADGSAVPGSDEIVLSASPTRSRSLSLGRAEGADPGANDLPEGGGKTRLAHIAPRLHVT